MDKIKPFGKNMLVKPFEKKQVIGQKSLCEYGTVVSIGELVTEIKVGDIIGYVIWGVKHLEIDEKRHYFIPEDDRFILGKITL